MTYIELPEPEKERRLVFYLAMEEYVASNLDRLLTAGASRNAFFMWQVSPTVIFGRNQVMEAEVNMEYCRRKGINLYRRKSGGGCVYSDWGNIMLSYITDSTDLAATFSAYLDELSSLLKKSGVNAEKSGRNDIMIDGRKVSGNAFFLKPKSSIVHGTMLFDSDFDELERAITPSESKIKSKGVSSVRQHVTNIRPYYGEMGSPLADMSRFKEYLKGCFCGSDTGIDSVMLTEAQVREIGEIEKTYLDPAFLEGRNHAYSVCHKGKIAGAGEIGVEFDIDMGVIERCRLSGDFFTLEDGLEELLTSRLRGLPDEPGLFRKALEGLDPGRYVAGLKFDGLLGIMGWQKDLPE